jgi:A/G-specific adenine glycosylase
MKSENRQGRRPAAAICDAAIEQHWHTWYRQVGICRQSLARFRQTIFHYYLHHRRDFSWRHSITPYRVVVSELMLQQTQTNRVEQKFDEFVSTFPDIRRLAEAPFAEVLRVWKGLGYNRRARYLHETAGLIVDHHNGRIPDEPDVLVRLPGIGPATAASICVFAYDLPLAFIETNIRTVFIHFFFPDETAVHDRSLMTLIEKTLDRQQPRQWYYALMDYGAMLKKTVGNVNRRSAHYQRQSKFEGSDRQIRGRILQLLLERQRSCETEISVFLDESPDRIRRLVEALCDEGTIVRHDRFLALD